MNRYIRELNRRHHIHSALLGAASAPLLFGGVSIDAMATAPCGDFGECKAIIEINSSDGDIGFHFLMDGDDLNSARIHDPNGAKVFEDEAKGPLREQKLTETFAESAEPPCWLDPSDPEADPDEVVTLEDFLDRWDEGTYVYTGSGDGGEKSEGETELTYELPAAPMALAYNAGVISWQPGNDLGNCATSAELTELVNAGPLTVHPMNVAVEIWEVVFEPDDGSGLKLTIRLPGSVAPTSVTVPADYLASLPNDTPAKIEVGAIEDDDNATFTELGDICVNDTGVPGC